MFQVARERAADPFEGIGTVPHPVVAGNPPPLGAGAGQGSGTNAQAAAPFAQLYDHAPENGSCQLRDPAAFARRIRETAEDRARAARELAPRFQIVPDDHGGPRAGNQVTRAEFDALARQYSDIRRGETDIQIDTHELDERAAGRYRANLMERFAQIMQTRSGRDLVSGLASNPRHNRVLFGAFHTGDLPTEAASQWHVDHTPVVHHENADVRAIDDRLRLDDNRRDLLSQHGVGSGVRISVNPEDDHRDGDAPWARSVRGDVTMFHEMVHAYHAVRGDLPAVADRVTSGVDRGAAQAEHQAVGLGRYAQAALSENAYRRERREIARGTVGVLPGDATMLTRDAYHNGGGTVGPAEDPRCTVGCGR